MEVLERSSHNDNGSHQRMHPAQYGHSIESYDEADVYHSPEAMVDFDPTEQPDVYNQVANFEFLGNREQMLNIIKIMLTKVTTLLFINIHMHACMHSYVKQPISTMVLTCGYKKYYVFQN